MFTYLSRTLLLFLLTLSFSIGAFAQQANFEAAERFTQDRMEKMTGDTQINPQWIEDQDRFWYSYENPSGTHWYFVDAQDGEKSPLLTLKMACLLFTSTVSILSINSKTKCSSRGIH
jgi:hypothetical protein